MQTGFLLWRQVPLNTYSGWFKRIRSSFSAPFILNNWVESLLESGEIVHIIHIGLWQGNITNKVLPHRGELKDINIAAHIMCYNLKIWLLLIHRLDFASVVIHVAVVGGNPEENEIFLMKIFSMLLLWLNSWRWWHGSLSEPLGTLDQSICVGWSCGPASVEWVSDSSSGLSVRTQVIGTVVQCCWPSLGVRWSSSSWNLQTKINVEMSIAFTILTIHSKTV